MVTETPFDPIVIDRGSSRSSPEVPSSPSFVHLPGYQRVPSLKVAETSGLDDQPITNDGAAHSTHDETNSSVDGLAISSLSFASRRSRSRAPSESKSLDTLSNPVESLVKTSLRRAEDYGNNESLHDTHKHSRSPSFVSSIHEPWETVPDTERLYPTTPVSATYGQQRSGTSFTCKSRRDIVRERWHWVSITILILAIYSTTFSAIWLVVAALKPRYGAFINTTSGRLSPINASTLTAAIAKTIELSFVTVFVAFIGQVLSRRAIVTRSKGITIAEMSTRHWVTQPGMMLTNWGSVKHAGNTTLGILSLIAVIVAVLYTTASDTLDAPKLKLGRFEDRTLYGRVATSFANASYTEGSCQTPITKAIDPIHSAESCIEIQYSGQAFHNLNQYLGAWATTANSNNKSTDLQQRPPPTAMLYDNTTVQGSWISTNQTMTEVSEKYGRIVNNVTMAMPHSGVFGASQLPQNGILQPEDFSGLGQFFIGASVPSPAVNVLCAAVSRAEISPLVYETWPGAQELPFNGSSWPLGYDLPRAPDWLNSTPVDDVFEFGERYSRRPPIFPKFPSEYNTILNTTIEYVDALYILAASSSDQYMLCSLSASLTPNCSTWYNSSISGGVMWSHCEDINDPLAYSKSHPNATNGFREKDWVSAAFYWAVTVDLNGGISDSDDSTARLLTQLMPTKYSLDPALPSIAEALAVLAGPTLLTGSIDSPFVHFFNYTIDVFDHPVLQQFPATLAYQDYASGGDQTWQGVFYIVLAFAFVLNLLCLGYFIWFGSLVNDFTEPQNLFALALNSPQSQQLAGSCGGGPEGEQLRATWFIDVKNDHCFMKDGISEHDPLLESPYLRSEFTYKDSPISRSHSKLSGHRSSIL